MSWWTYLGEKVWWSYCIFDSVRYCPAKGALPTNRQTMSPTKIGIWMGITFWQWLTVCHGKLPIYGWFEYWNSFFHDCYANLRKSKIYIYIHISKLDIHRYIDMPNNSKHIYIYIYIFNEPYSYTIFHI